MDDIVAPLKLDTGAAETLILRLRDARGLYLASKLMKNEFADYATSMGMQRSIVRHADELVKILESMNPSFSEPHNGW